MKGKKDRMIDPHFGTPSAVNKNGPVLQVLQHFLPHLHRDVGLFTVRLAVDQVICADLYIQATRALS
jgi:hypothetical protein